MENTATDKTGTMKFTVREDGTAQLHVEDVLAPYQLIVHKVNDHAKVLEGAGFTLYADKDCKQELQKATPVEQMESCDFKIWKWIKNII